MIMCVWWWWWWWWWWFCCRSPSYSSFSSFFLFLLFLLVLVLVVLALLPLILKDMAEKQAEIEEIQSVYVHEVQQLKELEHRFSELEVDYNAIMEERRLAVRSCGCALFLSWASSFSLFFLSFSFVLFFSYLYFFDLSFVHFRISFFVWEWLMHDSERNESETRLRCNAWSRLPFFCKHSGERSRPDRWVCGCACCLVVRLFLFLPLFSCSFSGFLTFLVQSCLFFHFHFPLVLVLIAGDTSQVRQQDA